MPRYTISGGGVPAILNKVLRIVTTSIQAFWVGPTNALSTFLVNTTNKRVGINVGTGAPDAKLSIANDEGGAGTDPEVSIYYQGTADAGIATKYFDLFGHQTAGVMDGGTIRMFNKTVQTIQISSNVVLPTFFVRGITLTADASQSTTADLLTLKNASNVATARFYRSGFRVGNDQDPNTTYLFVADAAGGVRVGDALTFANSGNSYYNLNSTGFSLPSNLILAWSNGAGQPWQTKDVAIGRNGVGILEVNNGTLGTLRDLIVRNLGIAGVADNVKSGTYTPVATNPINLDTTPTIPVASWMRVGDMVTVCGEVPVNPTAGGTAGFEMSLPIASNFAQGFDAGGVAAHYSAGFMQLNANVANNTIDVAWTAVDLGLRTYSFQFTYRII